MHRPPTDHSIFTYTISRRYPSSSVTWIVVIGGTILAVLFSFVATASNAYQFASIYTTNPNATVAAKKWFQKAPFSWLADMDSTCQPALLTVGSQYLTTNRGFVYTLDKAQRGIVNATGELLSAIAYANSTLDRCEVSDLGISLSRHDNSRLPANRWTWGGSSASATVTCTLDTESGAISVNLTTELPAISEVDGKGAVPLAQNSSGNLDMWHGAQILSAWYVKMSASMGFSAPGGIGSDDDAAFGYGSVQLARNYNVSDYADTRFFLCSAKISDDKGGLYFMNNGYTIDDWTNQWSRSAPFKLPNISIEVDTVAKTYYSLLLSDFGVSNESTNALASKTGVEYLQTVNDTYIVNASHAYWPKDSSKWDDGSIGRKYNPDSDPFQEMNNSTPITLYTQYLCSVPKQKGGFALFFSVLLADIVFLQACWSLFGWVATWWLGRHDAHQNYCAGCIEALGKDDLALAERAPSGTMTTSQEYLPVGDGSSRDRRSLRDTVPLVREHSMI